MKTDLTQESRQPEIKLATSIAEVD